MDENTYLKDRLEDQIGWYSKKSINAQKWYKRLKRTEIFLSLITTAMGAYAAVSLTVSCLNLSITVATIIAVCGAVLSFMHFEQGLGKYHENWIAYRQTCELLKHEKYLYLTKSGGYANNNEAFNVLVERCESIISSENVDWAQLHAHEKNNDCCKY